MENLKCSITNHELGKYDVIENSVKIGDRTVLFLPSIHSLQKLHPISSQVDFHVIERTNLTSLSEGKGFSYSTALSSFDFGSCLQNRELDSSIYTTLT